MKGLKRTFYGDANVTAAVFSFLYILILQSVKFVDWILILKIVFMALFSYDRLMNHHIHGEQ